MSDQPTQPTFRSVTPIIRVADVPTSIRYYVEALGFENEFGWSSDAQAFVDDAPDFACVYRGNVSFFLDHGDQSAVGTRHSIFLNTLDELEALHHEYRQSGATIVEPPEDKPWGMREMLVSDPDGNTFRIGVGLGQEG